MSKALWNFLLILTGGLALWRGAMAGWDLWQYGRLEMDVPVREASFVVVPKGSKYGLEGSYSYVYQGQEFAGKAFLSGPYYLNRSSAEMEIRRMDGMSWVVWIDAKKPTVSSLERNFPYREIFYAICLFGIFLYFSCLAHFRNQFYS